MRRAVGFTFVGEGKSRGTESTAPFRVSEISAGTEAAQKLLVGDEIVQVGDFRVDSTVDLSALRRVIIANPAPSVTVEVRRGAQSHTVSINKRGACEQRRAHRRWSLPTDPHKEQTSTPSSGGSRSSNRFDETEAPSSVQSSTREAIKSVTSMRRQSSSASLGSGPSISPPPLPPSSEELANGGSVHMQNQEQHIASALENSESLGNRRPLSLSSRYCASGEVGAAGAPMPKTSGELPNSCPSISRGGRGSAGPWAGQSESPSTTLSSSTTMASPMGDSEWAWRESVSGCSIEELERGLKASVDDLTAQCESADALVLELSALKKRISSTARSISVRNGSIMDEWDNQMRIMRNELFSMCGLLAEAEDDLKAAMERADELVRYVSTAIFGTAGDNEKEEGNGAVHMGREEFVEFRLELGTVRQRLKKAVTTCQNCILAVEDDLDAISEQARLSDLHNDTLYKDDSATSLHGAARQQTGASSCVNTLLCSGTRL